MIEELKPCPFCGGDAEITKWHEGYFVECKKQRCGGTIGAYKTEEEAIEAWNTRAERTCKAEQDYDTMDDGIPDCRIWKCSCGESFPFWRGLNPCFCPNCGAKVIADEG